MEPNLEQQTPKLPKLNVTNVSSAVFGKEGSALGKESKIGKLSRILRTTRIKVNTIEKILPEHQEVIGSTAKKAFANARKITSIKNILKNQKSKVGEKLPKSNKENFVKTLAETNKILVEIQKQLASDFSMQVAEQKEDEQKEKKERSREKLKAEESALEKGRKKIGAALAKTTEKVISPFKGIFDQIKEFVMTVGAGIAVNAAFKWLSEEENRKKMEDAFAFLKNNWKWIAGVAAGLFLMSPIIGIVSAIISVGTTLATIGGFLFSVLGAPGFLALLAIIGAGAGLYALERALRGGDAGAQYDRRAREEAAAGGINPKNFNTGAVVLNEDGTPRFVNVFDLPEGDPQKLPGPSLTGRKAKPGQENRNLRVPLNISNDAHRKYIRRNDGPEVLAQYDAAEKLFRARITAKDKVKADMESEWNKITGRTGIPGRLDFLGAFAELGSLGNKEKREKIDALNLRYGTNLDQLFENMTPRAMGGPVMSGKPYLVGESGPELFMPNINGTIVDNTRTEKIYQVLASGRRGKMRTITLPPQSIERKKPEVQMPLGAATKEPKISSSNPFDASRLMTSEIYGISV